MTDMKNRTVRRFALPELIASYDNGYISMRDFCAGALIAADGEPDLDAFVRQIPSAFFENFVREVFDYPLDVPGVTVGALVSEAPRSETILRLRQILDRSQV